MKLIWYMLILLGLLVASIAVMAQDAPVAPGFSAELGETPPYGIEAATVSAFLDDQFTDADGVLLMQHTPASGGTLTKLSGTSGVITANRARSIASAYQFYAYSAAIPDQEFDVEFTVSKLTAETDQTLGVGWIDPATSNGYMLLARLAQGYIRIARIDNGIDNSLGSYVIPGGFPVGDSKLKLEFRSGLKTAYLDTGAGYVQRLTTTDATYPTAVKVGIHLSGAAGVAAGGHLNSVSASTAAPPVLQSGAASLVSASDTAIAVEAIAAQWGTTPYSYQWHRGTSSGFIPNAMTAVAGGTNLFLSDSPGAAGLYFYRLVVTDAEQGTAYSNQVAATLLSAPLAVGFIGDSITQDANGPWPQDLSERLAVTPLRSVTAVNRGQSGALSSGWHPAGGTYQAAAAAFTAAGCTHTVIMLGVNDCKNSVDPAVYGANIAATANAEVAAGRKVILAYPTGFTVGVTAGFDEAALQRLTTYFAELDSLANGTTILVGPNQQFSLFATTPSLLTADGVHPNSAGSKRLASIMHGWFVDQGF